MSAGGVPALFTGLSAFPLTPLADDAVDEAAFAALVARTAGAGVDSVTVLGSTGSYAYLDAAERAFVSRIAVDAAGGVPVFVGVGALRTSQVLANVAAAEDAGAAGVLLAPVSYQPLTDDDVLGLFADVTARTTLPVIVYDNPGTTRFRFSVDLYGRIAELPGIASIKIPGVPTDPEQARDHVSAIRAAVPAHVGIGVSGDARAADGLAAGCDAWYSVVGGLFPSPAMRLVRVAQAGRHDVAAAESDRLAPLWNLFAEFGSVRVVAAAAEQLGLARRSCLPLPLRGLDDAQRSRLADVLRGIGLDS